MTLQEIINRLRTQPHRYCEDEYYACPLADDGYGHLVGNWDGGTPECNCGWEWRQQAADTLEKLDAGTIH